MAMVWKVVILTVAMVALVAAAQEKPSGHGRFLLQEGSTHVMMGKRRLLNERCGGSIAGVCKLKGKDVRCCKGVCRDVNNDDDDYCGNCDTKCSVGQKCCAGKCVNVLKDSSNCRFCGKKCPTGQPCQSGICGYNFKW